MNRFSQLERPRKEAKAYGSSLSMLWATIAGLSVPVLIVVFGLIAELLDRQGLTQTPVRLGTHLAIPVGDEFLRQEGFTQLWELVVAGILIAAVFCLTVWLNRRASDARARGFVRSLHRQVMRQSHHRAEFEGAATQQERAGQLIRNELPQMGIGMSMWHRVIPRNVWMLVGCVVLALLVNVWLAILAVIAGIGLWRLYVKLRNPEWLELSRYEIPQIRSRLVSLIGNAPMMARLQAGGYAEQAFDSELESLDRRIAGDDARRGRLWPILMWAGSLTIAVIILGLGGNILQGEDGLSLPAALVLGLALTGAGFSAGKLTELARQVTRTSAASESVYLYLQQDDDAAPSEQRVGLAGLRQAVTMRNVLLQDSAGKAILQDFSLSLQPKSLVALLGTEETSTRAVAEILMGFGRPNSGTVQIDGISLLDVHPKALAKQVMWIAPDGPLWEGTVAENLMSGLDKDLDKHDVVKVLERLGVYERITRLPDGLESVVDPASDGKRGDDLGSTLRYTLGIARALLHRPPILLVQEPPAPTEHLDQDPCLSALQTLVGVGSLVVVLPRRLKTLRSADRVVLLNGPSLVGEGRHTELLNSSDLYRHLNYLLFNPYRHRASL